MLTLTHAYVSGLIVQQVHHPAPGYLLVLISHYFLDAIPHWDFGTNLRRRSVLVTGLLASLETSIGVVIPFLVFRNSVEPLYLIGALMISVLPDWIQIPWYLFYNGGQKQHPASSAGRTEKISYYVARTGFRFHTKAGLGMGIATQIVTVLFFYFLLK